MSLAYLVVNFGGPRNTSEIGPFLNELLCDRDVIHSGLPHFIHRYVFGRVARKRALTIRHDYEALGGGSPIYFDTEEIARKLAERLMAPVATFHRYLPATHAASLQAIEALDVGAIRVVPLFPQFTFATTGSVARFLSNGLSDSTRGKLRWISSYCDHPAFIAAYSQRIRAFLREANLAESDVALLFSFHGLPRSFVRAGDIYETECQRSFASMQRAFPQAICHMSYQSKFGRGEWLRPYTDECCNLATSWSCGREKIVVVPLSFTSDHIETLFEIERLYLPLLRKSGVEAFRCPALNVEPYWVDALAEIASSASSSLCSTAALVRF